jgi:hypothetical protein
MNRISTNKKSFDLICFMLLKTITSEQIRQNRHHQNHREQGYAMLLASVMTILIFSILSIYMFSSRLYKSSANAIVDGGTTFYAAESGMNKRAHKTHAKFVGFSQPDGDAPDGLNPSEKMANCIAGAATQKGSKDFQCDVEYFDSYEQIESATGIINIASKKSKDGNNAKYAAYTYVQPNPQKSSTYPTARRIPAGEVFAGLNAIEYSYRIYASALKSDNAANANANNANVTAQTLLQMDFNSRVIPLFQFAAFYENDLEINPSPNMSLNGPVHTNGKLYMAPGNDLRLEGQVTSVGDMYNSMAFISTHSKGSTPQIKVKIGSGVNDYYDISTLIAWTQANNLLSTADITASSGKLKPKIDRLDIPKPGFLSKAGEYYAKADMQVEFTPNSNLSTVPFKINAKSAAGAVTTTALDNNSLRSLRQPVMLDSRANEEQVAFCGGVQTSPLATTVSLSNSEKGLAARAMYAAIVAQPTPVPYSWINKPLSDSASSSLQTTFDVFLDDAGLKTKKQLQLLNASPKDIVALAGNCFLPAPFQVVSVNDRREGRNVQVLQANIRSIAIWNRDGKTVASDVNGVLTNSFGGLGVDTTNQLYAAAPADPSAPASSLRVFGMAAIDRSEGGLVWHLNLDKAAYPYTAGKSVYGFGFSDGANLPSPLTLASEQAIYLQGDYNNIDSQAAAVMGDTIAVLSNACTNADRVISCGDLNDASGNPVQGTYASLTANATYSGTPANVPVATPTTIRAAFLSQTDLTNIAGTPFRYSGGLNNYIRMLENWQNVPLTYVGSFISLGTPTEFSGPYQYGRTAGNIVDRSQSDYYYYYPPIRNFSFDTNFNVASQLPPLTPKVVYLNQKVFKRDYDSNRN